MTPKGRRVVVASLPYAEVIKGEERGGGRSHNDFPGIEISIAGGVEECNKPAFLEVFVTGNDYRDYPRLSI